MNLPRFQKMVPSLFGAAAVSFFGSGLSHAFVMDFEGVAPDDYLKYVSPSYEECGFSIFNIADPQGVNKSAVIGKDGIFDNLQTSAYYAWDPAPSNNPVNLAALSGNPFSLTSFEVGSLDGIATTLFVTGYLYGGGSVDLTVTNATSFVSVTPNWTNLRSVDFAFVSGGAGGATLDNLVINEGSSCVPDSGTTLSLLGLTLVGFASVRRMLA